MATYNVDLQDSNGNSYRPMANPDSKAEFSAAGTRANIASGESHRTLWGKVYKWFADLKAVAFTGSYGDLANKPSIPSGAAANYPVANNDVTNNAGYLVTALVAYQHGQEIDQLNSDLAARLPGGTGISWDGTNFWGTTTGGVKKKLGEFEITADSQYVLGWSDKSHAYYGSSNIIAHQNISVAADNKTFTLTPGNYLLIKTQHSEYAGTNGIRQNTAANGVYVPTASILDSYYFKIEKFEVTITSQYIFEQNGYSGGRQFYTAAFVIKL